MSHLSRRQLLAGFLGGLVPAAGTVVLARAILSGTVAEAREADGPPQSPATIRERADQVAAEQGQLGEGEDLQPVAFVNGGFRNGGGGGFRKGGFANGGGGGGGGFKNGGFSNGGGGAFKKGGFGNGGGGGGFRNGGFGNGGGGGGAFRNGAFRN